MNGILEKSSTIEAILTYIEAELHPFTISVTSETMMNARRIVLFAQPPRYRVKERPERVTV